MSKEGDIKRAIRKMAGRDVPMMQVAKVTGVDGELCSVEIDGMAVDGVRLRAVEDGASDGVLVVPSIGSYVLVADIGPENMSSMVVVAWSSVDSIEVHGGENGGMVNIGKLKEWMRNVENDLATLTQLLSTSVVAGNGAPLGIVFNPSTKSVESDIEDENVKH